MTCSIAHLPVLRVCAVIVRGGHIDGYLSPLVWWNRCIVDPNRIFCQIGSAYRDQVIPRQPITSSCICHLPCFCKSFARIYFCPGWDCYITNEPQIITSVSQGGGIRCWRILCPCWRNIHNGCVKNGKGRGRKRWQCQRRARRDKGWSIQRRWSGWRHKRGLRLKELCSKRFHALGQDRIDIRCGGLWWLARAGSY